MRIIGPIKQLLFYKLHNIVHYIASVNTPVPHRRKLVFLIDYFGDRIREALVIHTVQNGIYHKPFALFAFTLGFRHSDKCNKIDFLLRNRICRFIND